MRSYLRFIAFGALLLALVATACGDDDEGLPPTDVPYEVTAIDYAYVDLPEKIKAGTTLTLNNTSDAELHELVAVRLPDDEDRSVTELVQLPEEELAALFPGVATVVIAPPGQPSFPVEGTGVLTEPGRYAIICAIPTGVDPQVYLEAAQQSEGGPPEIEGAGPPHFVQGMIGEIEVVE